MTNSICEKGFPRQEGNMARSSVSNVERALAFFKETAGEGGRLTKENFKKVITTKDPYFRYRHRSNCRNLKWKDDLGSS